MKVAITVSEKGDNPYLKRRFGRCAYFLITDAETQERTFLDNPSASARGGAGTQAAQFLVERDVEAVISGDFGPNAYFVMESAGVQMFKADERQVDMVLADFRAGKLQRAMPHAGRGRGHGRRR